MSSSRRQHPGTHTPPGRRRRSYNSHRNPYFLSSGLEDGHGQILWSQPEVALYDRLYHGGAHVNAHVHEDSPNRTPPRCPAPLQTAQAASAQKLDS